MDVDVILVLINPTKFVIRGESSQDLKEGYKDNLSSTLRSQYWSLQA